MYTYYNNSGFIFHLTGRHQLFNYCFFLIGNESFKNNIIYVFYFKYSYYLSIIYIKKTSVCNNYLIGNECITTTICQ